MKRKFFWITAFSIAMGFLETSVVIYLRIILYPEGFDFPLKPITNDILVTELWREAATILMLVGAGVMVGRNALERFAFFLYSFAIWDIFYYVFLKIFIDWPESLMTWDVLFLIPITWTGPVITPVIISLLMIVLSIELIYLKNKINKVFLNKLEWILMISGALVVIIAFCWDYSDYILKHYSFSKLWSISESDLFNLSVQYVPQAFNWSVFILGITLILSSMTHIFIRFRPKIG